MLLLLLRPVRRQLRAPPERGGGAVAAGGGGGGGGQRGGRRGHAGRQPGNVKDIFLHIFNIKILNKFTWRRETLGTSCSAPPAQMTQAG